MGLALSLAIAPKAIAQSEDFVIVNGPAPADDCTAATARQVEFGRLTAHAADYKGRCVSVVGYWAFRALFSDLSATQVKYSNQNEVVQKRRVGLYLSDADLKRIPSEAVRARVIGQVGECADLGGKNVLMVFGYCHYTDGFFLNVSRIRALE